MPCGASDPSVHVLAPQVAGAAEGFEPSGASQLGDGSVGLHGQDRTVRLHEDALGVAAQDEFAHL